MSVNDVPKDKHLDGVKDPTWTCPNCREATFKSQRELIAHALPCKQGWSNN